MRCDGSAGVNAFTDLEAETLVAETAADDDDDTGIVFLLGGTTGGDRIGVSIVIVCIFAVGDTDIEVENGRDGSAGLRWPSLGEREETLVVECNVAWLCKSIWFNRFSENSTPDANGITLKKVPLAATMLMAESPREWPLPSSLLGSPSSTVKVKYN